MKCHPCTWPRQSGPSDQGRAPHLRRETDGALHPCMDPRMEEKRGREVEWRGAPTSAEEQQRPLPTGGWSCGLLAGIPTFFLSWNNISRWTRCRNSTKNCQIVFTQIRPNVHLLLHSCYHFSLYTHVCFLVFFLNHLRVQCRPLDQCVTQGHSLISTQAQNNY